MDWGGIDVFNQALAICNSGDLTDVRYDDETVTISGKLEQSSGWAMPISLKLRERGRVESHCPCAMNQRFGKICPHVVALGIAVTIQEMEEPAPPPKTSGNAIGTEDEEQTEVDESLIPVPMVPTFKVGIFGSAATLSVEVDAWYGDEINFPACSIQSDRTVWLEDPDDPLVRRTRSMKSEKDAVESFRKWGFSIADEEGVLRITMNDRHKVLSFLGSGYPELKRRSNWITELSPRLGELCDTFGNIIPVVHILDAPLGAFDVSYTFETTSDEEISPVEVQAAINRRDGYLRKGETVYLLDNAAVELMHDVFRDCSATQGGARPGWFRVKGVYAPYVRSSLGNLMDAIELDDSRADRWRSHLASRSGEDFKYEPVALGPLEGVLRPYQKQGVYWMRFIENAGLCGLLADEMGLGKTLQTLAWLSLPPVVPGPKRPALVVCPTSLVRNWEAEAHKFTPQMKVLVVSGPDRSERFSEIPSADLVITSYALLQRDFDAAYLENDFSTVILDEAQHIKNRDTKNAKAVKMLNASRRLVLTGTPIENSVADVWSIFDFLMPGYLGDYPTFKVTFEEPIRDSGDAAVLARLKRKLEPFILRRLKKSVAKDLPDKIVKVSYCPMSEDDQREYNAALSNTRRQAREVVRSKGFEKSRFELLALLMKLRQIASRAKVSPFMEQLLAAVAGGHKILVFSQFVTMLKTLAEELSAEGIRFSYLDGSTKDRLGECNRFNSSPEIQVFLISLMAGGTGLNLTGADMVMHYDPWWNPAVEDQATDRAHRIGQKKTVYVVKMIASGTVEEKVLALQRKKQAVISATVSTTDAAVMETLTAADVNELLS